VITNPPFRLAEQFVLRAMRVARRGVAILARTVFLESVGRYKSIYTKTPPTKFAQFVERVPMVKGRLDIKGDDRNRIRVVRLGEGGELQISPYVGSAMSSPA
jgi:hypothetical protein